MFGPDFKRDTLALLQPIPCFEIIMESLEKFCLSNSDISSYQLLEKYAKNHITSNIAA